MFIFLIIGLIAGALVIIFAAQNIAAVSVAFLAWQFQGSLALIIVLAVAAGMVIASLISLPDTFRKWFQISKLRESNMKLADELDHKKIEVEEEKNKSAATNAYLDHMI